MTIRATKLSATAVAATLLLATLLATDTAYSGSMGGGAGTKSPAMAQVKPAKKKSRSHNRPSLGTEMKVQDNSMEEIRNSN